MANTTKAFLTTADLERERAEARLAQPGLERALRVAEARRAPGSPVARAVRTTLAAFGLRLPRA